MCMYIYIYMAIIKLVCAHIPDSLALTGTKPVEWLAPTCCSFQSSDVEILSQEQFWVQAIQLSNVPSGSGREKR